jgi:hypothetical protein
MTGYQDYVRESKTAGTLLTSGQAVGSALLASAAFYCGDYEYLIITVDQTTSTHQWQVTPEFFTNSSLSTTMGFTQAALNGINIDSVVARVRGPWANVGFGPWLASNGDTVNYYVYGSNFAPHPQVGQNSLGPWGYYNASIPAGGTQIIPLSWHSGTALMSFMGQVANYPIVSLQCSLFTLGFQTYNNQTSNPNPNNAYVSEVPIPPIPVQIKLVASPTAATTAEFLFMPKAFCPI